MWSVTTFTDEIADAREVFDTSPFGSMAYGASTDGASSASTTRSRSVARWNTRVNFMLSGLGPELVKMSGSPSVFLTRCTASPDGSAPNSTVNASSVSATSPRKHDASNRLTARAFVNAAIGGT